VTPRTARFCDHGGGAIYSGSALRPPSQAVKRQLRSVAAERPWTFNDASGCANGGSAGARTQDQYLKRVLLYQLSYRPVRPRGGRDDTTAFATNHALRASRQVRVNRRARTRAWRVDPGFSARGVRLRRRIRIPLSVTGISVDGRGRRGAPKTSGPRIAYWHATSARADRRRMFDVSLPVLPPRAVAMLDPVSNAAPQRSERARRPACPALVRTKKQIASRLL
jgi:hypothetical protein